jgi:hypothetical protein
MTIPKEAYKYHKTIGFYITYQLVKKYHTKEEYEKFKFWINGQTCAIIKNAICVYLWDYKHWLLQDKLID